jgi:hypothetical protein
VKREELISIMVLMVLLLFLSEAYSDTWTATKRITNTTGHSSNPAIAVDGSNIYVVWMDITPGNLEIYFKQSADRGVTWSAGKRITNTAGHSYYPSIAVNGSNIYVVWEDETPGNSEIYFKQSADRGTTWTANKRLTKNALASWSPVVAVVGPNIYVAWDDYTPGVQEIFFKRSSDGGITWTKDKQLTNNPGSSVFPAIAADGSNIYIVWADAEFGGVDIFFKRSNDAGATWTPSMRLTYNAGGSFYPAIAVDGSNIYVVWEDNTLGNYEIYFKRSSDRGVSWTPNKRFTNNSGDSRSPAIAVDGFNVYVTWNDITPGNYEIYFKRSHDKGVTWTPNKRLTYNAGGSWEPTIAAAGSNIYVIWSNALSYPKNPEIYFKKGFLD